MKPPTVPESPVPVLGDDEMRRLLGACDGRGYEERRDAAIIRVFLDCGPRLAELTSLKVDDVDFGYGVVHASARAGDRGRLRSVRGRPRPWTATSGPERSTRWRPSRGCGSEPRAA